MGEIRFGSVAPVFPVEDVERSLAWYEDALGFKPHYVNRDSEGEDPTNYAVLERDGAWLHLMRWSEAEPGFSEHPSFFGRFRVATAQFSVSDVNAMFELLKGKGARVVRGLTSQPWGARDFTVEDPDGNWIWLSGEV